MRPLAGEGAWPIKASGRSRAVSTRPFTCHSLLSISSKLGHCAAPDPYKPVVSMHIPGPPRLQRTPRRPRSAHIRTRGFSSTLDASLRASSNRILHSGMERVVSCLCLWSCAHYVELCQHVEEKGKGSVWAGLASSPVSGSWLAGCGLLF
jgi:hypothetical protein